VELNGFLQRPRWQPAHGPNWQSRGRIVPPTTGRDHFAPTWATNGRRVATYAGAATFRPAYTTQGSEQA